MARYNYRKRVFTNNKKKIKKGVWGEGGGKSTTICSSQNSFHLKGVHVGADTQNLDAVFHFFSHLLDCLLTYLPKVFC